MYLDFAVQSKLILWKLASMSFCCINSTNGLYDRLANFTLNYNVYINNEQTNMIKHNKQMNTGKSPDLHVISVQPNFIYTHL